MCDYSLHVYPNRLASEGEELVVHRFGGTSLGLASRSDLARVESQRDGSEGFWARIKRWFEEQHEVREQICAVCVPPGAQLLVEDIPKRLQRELGVNEIEEVRFIEISAEVNTYRDAVRFKNGRQVLLQALREGQPVTVLSMDLAEVEEPVFQELRPAR